LIENNREREVHVQEKTIAAAKTRAEICFKEGMRGFPIMFIRSRRKYSTLRRRSHIMNRPQSKQA